MGAATPFAVRALIEGFYGVYYTHPERLSLLEFLAQHGFNAYIYAPKNDRQHRSRWREPYPEPQMRQFGETIARAGKLGIDFCYALSPGVDIRYSSAEDFAAITAKFADFHRLGVRSFSLLLDDIRREFADSRDCDAYASFSAAQADLCNRLFDWLQDLDDGCSLSMCPTEYHGAPPFSPALRELGSLLRPEIDVFYTGADVCSQRVERREVEAFAAALERSPLLWDNYPVNDLAMHGELHIGPIRNRSAELPGLLKGVAVNPMIQAEASKIVLATYGDYLAEPGSYEPEAAWNEALRKLAGEHHEALRLVAENSLQSCLGTPEAEPLERLVGPAEAALGSGLTDDPAVDELVDYLGELDEACYTLRYRLENLELRNELLPWLEQLERWSWLGRWSIEALRSSAAGVTIDGGMLRRIEEYVGLTDNHPKRIGGTLLRPLALLALERGVELEVVG